MLYIYVRTAVVSRQARSARCTSRCGGVSCAPALRSSLDEPAEASKSGHLKAARQTWRTVRWGAAGAKGGTARVQREREGRAEEVREGVSPQGCGGRAEGVCF